MTLNPRIVLVCATCIIISGFVGSYKGYQVYKDQIMDSQIVKSQTVAEFAGQNIQQKLSQIEASVSYLDQSTVETLKRFGIRYFAYAYQKQNEWSIKWKVLGEMGKDAILAEVKPLEFSKLSLTERHWSHTTDNKLIYISPVALAESHQLKEGFLIFGVQPEFFSSIKGTSDSYALVDTSRKEVFGSVPTFIENRQSFFATDDGMSRHLRLESETGTEIVTASFLPESQLWILRQESMAPVSFVSSRFFTYFLLTSGFGLLLLTLLMLGRKSSPEASSKAASKTVVQGFAQVLEILRANFRRAKTVEATEDATEFSEPNEDALTAEVREIKDFADFLDRIVAIEAPRLQKVGVTIKTQVEEGARVMCSPQRVTDFVKRLIGNSVLSLEGEDTKEIQIQMVEQPQSYQLIYVDSRTQAFPSQEPTSLMAQTEGSLQGIDGIIAYAGWLFGDRLTVAKKGFCLSVDLPKASVQAQVTTEPSADTLDVVPLTEALERIEIEDADTDLDMISGFEPVEPAKKVDDSLEHADDDDQDVDRTAEPKVNFDDVIDQFRMKDFSFNIDPKQANEKQILETESDKTDKETLAEDVELKEDDKGMFEFNSGQFKIKIRSPKKRDNDVSS